MSQQDIFKKAIAAKLAGDEEAFKAAISEAIKAKTKAMLNENQYKGDGVEMVGDDWFLITKPFAVPESNDADIPGGYYTASFKARADGLADRATVEALEIHPDGDDSIVASLTGEEANKFASQYLPSSALLFADSFVEKAYSNDDRLQDQAEDQLSANRAGM